jgi:hypothetical protein
MIKVLIWDEFTRGGCAVCHESCPAVLDAHHVDPRKKEQAMAVLKYDGASVERYYAEALKCVCLCSNCHRKVHAGLLACPGIRKLEFEAGSPVATVLASKTGGRKYARSVLLPLTGLSIQPLTLQTSL